MKDRETIIRNRKLKIERQRQRENEIRNMLGADINEPHIIKKRLNKIKEDSQVIYEGLD